MASKELRRLSAILFADKTERFAKGKVKGAKCTFKREGTEALSEDGRVLEIDSK